MAENKCSLRKEFTKGHLKENPVLRLVLGTCPTLATSTSMVNAIGMGISATLVLVCSNIAISALRKVIPDKVRIPAYIVIIASFVTIVQMLVKAFVPALNDALGVYLPLIVVNCIILGRAEAFASIGFTAALFTMSLFREFLGNGTLFSDAQNLLSVFGDNVLGGFNGVTVLNTPMTIFILPAGGFFVFGVLIALSNKIGGKKKLPKAEMNGCEGCPMASGCAHKIQDKEEKAV